MNVTQSSSTLPALTAQEAAHSAALRALLGERIAAAGGWIDFQTFMDLALYAPGLGYYSAGAVKIGGPGQNVGQKAGQSVDQGDFTTAPEMSDLFSRCVARQCAQVLEGLGAGGRILELGAGSGRMAAAVLRELASLGRLPQSYDILEVSADLAARQRELIGALPADLWGRVRWLTALPESPFEGVLLANEVLDALPCQRFVVRAGSAPGAVPEGHGGLDDGRSRQVGDDVTGAWVEALGVGLAADGTLLEKPGPASAALSEDWARLRRELPAPLPVGYTSEICLLTQPWIMSLADCLSRGVMLLFDYGLPRSQFYLPERTTGTLTAYFKHRAHYDPLINVGAQDLTAWVDFTRVAEAGLAAGLEVLGFCTQAGFLLGAGLDSLLAQARDPIEQLRLAGEARRLLLPGEMGEAFKLMALGRGWDEPLAAFTHQDLRGSL